MARKLRIQFPGARYHVINRGNYRSDIYASEGAALSFLRTVTEAAQGKPEGVRPSIATKSLTPNKN